MTGLGPGLRTTRLSVSDEKWSVPLHQASLTPLWVQTVSSGVCTNTEPAAIVQGPWGQAFSCSSVAWVLHTISLSSLCFLHLCCFLPMTLSTLLLSFCLFSTLTSSPIASLHGNKSIITVWAWLRNIFPILFLNRIFSTAYLFWVPNGDSGYLCKSSIRQLRCAGANLLVTVSNGWF